MANGQQSTYDLSSVAQDPGFINAPAQDKIAYLSAHDADFAKASPTDKAGYLNHILGYDKPSEIEKAGATPGRLEAGNEVAGKILGGVGLPTSLADTSNWVRRFTGQAPDSKPFWQPFVDAYKAPSQRSIVGAVPFIGPAAVSAADEPTLLGKAASLTGTAGGVALAREVAPGLRAGKAELAEAVRTPENTLTPKVNALSRIGTLAGGPQLADAFLPKRPELPNFYGGAYEPPVQPVLGPDTPTRGQFALSRKIALEQNPMPPPELGSPENPGFHAKLPTRMPKVAPSAVPPKPDPFAGATPSNVSLPNRPLPSAGAYSPPPAIVQGLTADAYSPPEGIKGSIAKPSGRLILSPEEARAESVMQGIAKTRASQHGTLYAAGMRPAGGGRVPMTPTGTETFEYPQRSAYDPPDAQYSRTGGAEGPYSPPNYAYRVHDANVGPEEFDLNRSHAHATTSPEEAVEYQASRNPDTPQAISKNDLSGLREGVDYDLVDGPRGNKWVRFKTPRAKGEFSPHE